MCKYEQIYRRAFESNPNPTCFFDQDTGVFFEVNQAMINHYGYSKEEFLEMMITDIYTSIALPRLHQINQNLINTEQYVEETQHYKKDGSVIDVEMTMSAFLVAGQQLNLMIIKDITRQKQSEEELKIVNNRLSLALKSGGIGCWDWNIPLNKLVWDEQLCQLYGLETDSDIDYNLWANALHPDDRLSAETIVQEALWDHTGYDTKFRIVLPDGNLRFIKSSAIVLKDSQGNPQSMIGVNFDISQIKDIENTLRESQQFLQTVLDTFPLSIFWKDRDLVMLGCNQLFAKQAGLKSPLEVIGKTDFELGCTESEILSYQTDDRQVMESGIAKLGIEETVTRHTGEQSWVETNKLPLKDLEGNIVGIVATFQDITNRKLAEKILLDYNQELEKEVQKRTLELEQEIAERKQLETWFLEAQQVSHIGNWSYDLITGKIAWSANLFVILGRDQALGEPNYQENLQLYHPEDAQQLHQAVERAISHGNPYRLHLRLIKTNENFRYIEGRGQAEFNSEGQVIRLFGTAQDITERKQVEKSLRESQKRFQEISLCAPGAIYILVMRLDGSFYYEHMGRAFEDIYEITVEQVLQNTALYFNSFHPNDHANYLEAVINSLATMTPFNHEWRIITPSGKIKWIQANSRPEKRQNEEIVWYGVMLDITYRKQVEIALQEAEANLRQANLELNKLINIDGLTQIANRRYFDERLKQEWQRLLRLQEPLSLLLFDIDYFKRYNDCYGHQMGDECLIKIAQTVQNIVSRSTDLFARYGGEEFVVILPNTDIQGANLVAKKIHAAIKASAIPHLKSDNSSIVTTSMGIASLIPTLESSPNLLIKQADDALYIAKNQGRNQSVIFNSTVLPFCQTS